MFFLLCVCECSLTSAKSVQSNVFKVSANEASIKGESKASFTGPEASVTALETFRAVLYSACILIIPRSRNFSLPCINQRLELTDDEFLAMAESQLLPFFIRRPWPKCIFSHFVAFGRGRNAVFAVFHSSAVAESQFSAFSAFCRPPTDYFHCFFAFRRSTMSVFSQFLRFVGRRRTVFFVFRVSSVNDEQFSSFSTRRLQAKPCFSHFLHFAHER